ncbi:MAG TPA: energy transducer TonB [Gemmatimonadales bacterium]|nr:energy transducer TonB [Gemmatimonadales bacterium]
MRALTILGLIALVSCRRSAQPDTPGGDAQAPPESEAPVALNPDIPIAYPPSLFEQKVEGDVTLRLFVDSTGKLIPESTHVAEGSGYPALDSAAVAGSRALRFAPAKRHGVPVATEFLQPVEFRQVGTTATGGGGGTVTLPPAPAPALTPPPATPPPARRPRRRAAPVVNDTTKARADTTKAPADTTKARTDTSASAH